MANESRKIKQAQIKLQRQLKSFIVDMGVEAKNHFVKSFRNQGFEDETIERWQPRRGEIKGGIAMTRKKDKGSRAILVKSGDLRRSIKVVKKTYNSVTIGSDLPYAQIHNDGLYGRAFGKYRFKMPKRQFIGHSNKLIRILKAKLNNRIQQAFA